MSVLLIPNLLKALAEIPVGEKVHLGRMAETLHCDQSALIKAMEMGIGQGRIDRETLRPVSDEPINPLADQVKAVMDETGECWAAFARRAGVSYKSFNLFARRKPSEKTAAKIRAALGGGDVSPPKEEPYSVVTDRIEGLDEEGLKRRKARDAELLETRRGISASGGARSKHHAQRGTGRCAINGAAFRELGREVEEEKLATIQDVLREVGRRWPADWASIKAMARSDNVMPGIMLHRVVQAGLDCMREAG